MHLGGLRRYLSVQAQPSDQPCPTAVDWRDTSLSDAGLTGSDGDCACSFLRDTAVGSLTCPNPATACASHHSLLRRLDNPPT